jgi:hypothetical protein
MEWILLLIAMNINDPNDIPARVELQFNTEQECRQAADTLTYWVKFKQFKLEATCSQKK